ncbi:glycosyltransferase family 32 protein [Mycena alexandri]|uniref:Glycosyltransferase family 32 protein n=1 Tax=Mycena alexandri TaxID=1745969 RepID=A0AAD6T2M8_9AGAR|nr:glycosyltransferase family 32 protein [Mycena alexandri]
MSFNKARLRSGSLRSLPSHYSSSVVIEEKFHGRISPWFISVPLAIPGLRTRRLRIWMLNPRRMHQYFGRKRGCLLMVLIFAAMVFTTFALAKRFGTEEKTWPAFTGDPPTLVFRREDLQRIWTWEIASGHYPSRRRLPEQLGLKSNGLLLPPRFRAPSGPSTLHISMELGLRRSHPPNVAYPPRPVPGSIADLDIVMEHCDFSEKKYVRDCLEFLRLGGGLDNGKRLRRGKMDDMKYIYLEQLDAGNETMPPEVAGETPAMITSVATTDPDSGLTKKRGVDWEVPPIALPSPRDYRPYASLSNPCDPETPRIFHMFWAGPLADKPYIALLSFLFTQNTGLHLRDYPADTAGCRPQFWLWINPGPAAAVPNPSALHDMFAQLRSNPWAAPFLHPRFNDIIQFKLWNTTEQLDGVPELKDEWRTRDSLFNSGGHVISVPPKDATSSSGSGNETEKAKADEDDILNRTGEFGGIYLDADTIMLRDWEEMLGWKGAFAYRWSRLEKYNTAVLHLNKGSALGTFLFRTALKNDLDFHPMTVSRYLKEAHLEGLLLRLPDALFDSAWLNTEYYQRDRPPQPYFTDFADFFDTPLGISAAPHALGFDGFFKGAYSYHFHNYWWKPFDPPRNWPDLGPRFIEGERAARASGRAATQSAMPVEEKLETEEGEDLIEDDQRDLDWSTGERPNMYGEWLEW